MRNVTHSKQEMDFTLQHQMLQSLFINGPCALAFQSHQLPSWMQEIQWSKTRSYLIKHWVPQKSSTLHMTTATSNLALVSQLAWRIAPSKASPPGYFSICIMAYSQKTSSMLSLSGSGTQKMRAQQTHFWCCWVSECELTAGLQWISTSWLREASLLVLGERLRRRLLLNLLPRPLLIWQVQSDLALAFCLSISGKTGRGNKQTKKATHVPMTKVNK